MKRLWLLAFVFAVFSFQFHCKFDGVAPASGNAFPNKAIGVWVYNKPSTGSITYIYDTQGGGVYIEDGGPFVTFSYTLDQATLSIDMVGALIPKLVYSYGTDLLTDPASGNIYARQ